MNDIVEKLRNHPNLDDRSLLDEAANEIERLNSNIEAVWSMYQDAERSVEKLTDELTNHKHAEDAYIDIIDKLKNRIEHECVAWHSAEEWPERNNWVLVAIDGKVGCRTYIKCIRNVWVSDEEARCADLDVECVEWYEGHYYNEDGDDITDIVKWWCYEPEWPEEDEE